MDFDKVIVILKTFGFPASIAVWFLWTMQAKLEAFLVGQAQMIELLRQLVELHK